MKIALIQCPSWGRQNPPLALSLLAAYLRNKGKEVCLFDLNNELFHKVNDKDKVLWQLSNEAFWENRSKILQFFSEYDDLFNYFVKEILKTGVTIVGFSTFNSSKELSLLIARKIKEICPDKKIVFGGPHCALHMQGMEIIKDTSVDIAVVGEGEITLDEIVNLIEERGGVDFSKGTLLKKDGNIINCGNRDLIEDLNLLPFADFKDFLLSSYDEPYRLPIYIGRGCPNKCVYCNENILRGYRFRSGKRVFEEIKYQINKHRGVTHFDFADSLVNANIKELSCLAELLIDEELKITWAGQAVIRSYMTLELLTKLKQSGCVCLAYGMESGSQKVLDLMKKRFRVEDAERVIRDTHNAGIDVVTNFMFGFPGETDKNFEETLGFVFRNRKYITTVNPSLAYTAIGVGTYLYEHPKEYDIDLSYGYLYWKSRDGENTYDKRQKRYEDFCKAVSSLGIKFSYPINIR